MTTKLHFSTSENYSIRPHWSNSILQPCFLLSPSRNSWTQLSKNLQPKIYQHLVYSSYASVFHCRPSHHGWRQNVLLAVDTFLHRPHTHPPNNPKRNIITSFIYKANHHQISCSLPDPPAIRITTIWKLGPYTPRFSSTAAILLTTCHRLEKLRLQWWAILFKVLKAIWSHNSCRKWMQIRDQRYAHKRSHLHYLTCKKCLNLPQFCGF